MDTSKDNQADPKEFLGAVLHSPLDHIMVIGGQSMPCGEKN